MKKLYFIKKVLFLGILVLFVMDHNLLGMKRKQDENDQRRPRKKVLLSQDNIKLYCPILGCPSSAANPKYAGFKSIETFNDHMLVSHLTCPWSTTNECSKKNAHNSLGALYRHIIEDHPKKPFFKCEECLNYLCFSQRPFITHQRKCTKLPSSVKNSDIIFNTGFYCHVQNCIESANRKYALGFAGKSSLDNHLLHTHNLCPWSEMCGEKGHFKKINDLYEHIKSKHSSEAFVTCDTCNFFLSCTKQGYTSHKAACKTIDNINSKIDAPKPLNVIVIDDEPEVTSPKSSAITPNSALGESEPQANSPKSPLNVIVIDAEAEVASPKSSAITPDSTLGEIELQAISPKSPLDTISRENNFSAIMMPSLNGLNLDNNYIVNSINLVVKNINTYLAQSMSELIKNFSSNNLEPLSSNLIGEKRVSSPHPIPTSDKAIDQTLVENNSDIIDATIEEEETIDTIEHELPENSFSPITNNNYDEHISNSFSHILDICDDSYSPFTQSNDNEINLLMFPEVGNKINSTKDMELNSTLSKATDLDAGLADLNDEFLRDIIANLTENEFFNDNNSNLFSPITSSPQKSNYVGIVNENGTDCFMNASLQILAHIPEFTKTLKSSNPFTKTLSEFFNKTNTEQNPIKGAAELRNFIAHNGNGLNNIESGTHDAQEFLCKLINHLNDENPEIQNIFQVQLQSDCHCQQTGCPLQLIDSSWIIPLHLSNQLAPLSTQFLVNNFFKKELINDYQCENCGKKGLYRTIKPQKLPAIITTYFKRFVYVEGVERINTPVNVEEYLFIDNKKYELIGLILHHNTSDGKDGHYTAQIKDSVSKEWYHCNDSIVEKISGNEVIGKSSEVYLCFYRLADEDNEQRNEMTITNFDTNDTNKYVQNKTLLYCKDWCNSFCNKSFSNIKFLYSHIARKHKCCPLAKESCNHKDKFSNPNELHNHWNSQHPNCIESFYCEACDYLIFNSELFKNHKNTRLCKERTLHASILEHFNQQQRLCHDQDMINFEQPHINNNQAFEIEPTRLPETDSENIWLDQNTINNQSPFVSLVNSLFNSPTDVSNQNSNLVEAGTDTEIITNDHAKNNARRKNRKLLYCKDRCNSYCYKAYSRTSNLYDHIINIHKACPLAKKSHKEICNKTTPFKSLKEIHEHLKKKHPNCRKNFYCEACDFLTFNISNFKNHKKTTFCKAINPVASSLHTSEHFDQQQVLCYDQDMINFEQSHINNNQAVEIEPTRLPETDSENAILDQDTINNQSPFISLVNSLFNSPTDVSNQNSNFVEVNTDTDTQVITNNHEQNNIRKINKKLFYCKDWCNSNCNKAFSTCNGLYSHIVCEYQYCPLAKKSCNHRDKFANLNELHNHWKNQHPNHIKSFYCEACDFLTFVSANFKNHKNTKFCKAINPIPSVPEHCDQQEVLCLDQDMINLEHPHINNNQAFEIEPTRLPERDSENILLNQDTINNQSSSVSLENSSVNDLIDLANQAGNLVEDDIEIEPTRLPETDSENVMLDQNTINNQSSFVSLENSSVNALIDLANQANNLVEDDIDADTDTEVIRNDHEQNNTHRENKKLFYCKDRCNSNCNKTYHRISNLYDHIVNIHKVCPWAIKSQNEICNKTTQFESLKKIHEHLNKKHPNCRKSLYCEACDFLTFLSTNFKNHKNTKLCKTNTRIAGSLHTSEHFDQQHGPWQDIEPRALPETNSENILLDQNTINNQSSFVFLENSSVSALIDLASHVNNLEDTDTDTITNNHEQNNTHRKNKKLLYCKDFCNSNCNKTYTKFPQLYDHIVKEHQLCPWTKKSHKEKCSKSTQFKSLKKIHEHLNKKHPNCRKSFYCEACNYLTFNITNFRSHKNTDMCLAKTLLSRVHRSSESFDQQQGLPGNQ